MKANWTIACIAVICVIAMLFSCEFGGRKIVIEEVAVPRRFVLRTTEKYPANIRISLSGNLNGRASLGMIEIGPGEVYYSQLLDCYADTFLIKYAPIDATEGKIVLRYWY